MRPSSAPANKAAPAPVPNSQNERLRAATGWEPEIPLDQTLDDLLSYWRGR